MDNHGGVGAVLSQSVWFSLWKKIDTSGCFFRVLPFIAASTIPLLLHANFIHLLPAAYSRTKWQVSCLNCKNSFPQTSGKQPNNRIETFELYMCDWS